MTAEKKCEVCKGLLDWAKTTNEDVLYMEERVYAVKMPDGMCTLVRADNPREAVAKARRTICMTQTGNGGTQIGYVGEINV